MQKVSIIVPAYNKSELTVRTVESILQQTYANIEILVVDDGSKDDTQERLAVYKDKIQYIYKKNGGACSARNEGIRQATGEFIAFLDCDDLYEKKKVEFSIEYLIKNSTFGSVYTDAYFIDTNDHIVGQYAHPKSIQHQGNISSQLILGNFICNSTMVVRKSVIQKVGFFDETIFTPADWDMWMRIAEIAPMGYINEPLTHYRVTDNYIFNRLKLAEKEERIVLNKYFERNRPSSFFQKKILSNFYLRYAMCYFLKKEPKVLKEKYFLSLRENFLNFKAWGIFLYFLFAKEHLRENLSKRILRIKEK